MKVDRPVRLLILAEYFLQLINLAFFLILNLYMAKQGYQDEEIADFISYRFLAIMVLAIPVGLYIKGRRIRPNFYFSSLVLPAASMGILYGIENNIDSVIYIGFVIWGIAFTTISVTMLPFVLRNTKEEYHSEAISLHFITFSAAMFSTGLLIFILNNWLPEVFDERVLLWMIASISFISFVFVAMIKIPEIVPKEEDGKRRFFDYDWLPIIKATVPIFVIAMGAGLTIPFVNLYFYHIFEIDTDMFSLMGTITALLVVYANFNAPRIRRKFGYIALTYTQTIGIIVLIIMATMEFFAHLQLALWVAVICYILRQPLMNMSWPLALELAMYYVGKRNQEMLSAIVSALWSGSWFFSSQLFKILRAADLSYAIIFYITATLLLIGLFLFHLLIKDYNRTVNPEVEPMK
ncbi:MAG: MFS transporter [Bacteroidetes bacterium]|nr:MFS transporter [Bacteroidota bacterium]